MYRAEFTVLGDDERAEIEARRKVPPPRPAAMTTTPNRKQGPRTEKCHQIGDDFNGYGNLSSEELLYGVDEKGDFLVPSYHVFGGIYLKIIEDYDHNAIASAMNAKRAAEGLNSIEKSSCSRRLSSANKGKEQVDAEKEGRVPDPLQAQVDYDVAHGKDESVSRASRTQKWKSGSTNAQYGDYTTPTKKPKRQFSQTETQDEAEPDVQEESRPRKVTRKPKRQQKRNDEVVPIPSMPQHGEGNQHTFASHWHPGWQTAAPPTASGMNFFGDLAQIGQQAILESAPSEKTTLARGPDALVSENRLLASTPGVEHTFRPTRSHPVNGAGTVMRGSPPGSCQVYQRTSAMQDAVQPSQISAPGQEPPRHTNEATASGTQAGMPMAARTFSETGLAEVHGPPAFSCPPAQNTPQASQDNLALND